MNPKSRPFTVAIGGFASEVGKTTVLCALLAEFAGWEAIKTTRGHYRSCGKDPQTCCVSHLLTDEPVIRSGREATYEAGKDTGRYWDAGAANVHWLIVTEEQVEEGSKCVIERVKAPGVFIEGNSISEFVPVDFLLMVARAEGDKIKSSARRALRRASGLYLSEANDSFAPDKPGGLMATAGDQPGLKSRERFADWGRRSRLNELRIDIPIYTREDLPQLVSELHRLHLAPAA